jgi:diketogulonate reductase-like aldo/keto reductase
MNKIIIGAANFGVRYGISKKTHLTIDCMRSIAEQSKFYGIDTIDTAIEYYGSHKAIASNKFFDEFKLITKLKTFALENYSELQIYNKINSKFQHGRVRTVLMHDEDFYMHSCGLKVFNALLLLKNEGKIDNVGVSVYQFHHAENIINNFNLDIIQIPYNPFNKEFNEEKLSEFKKKNLEIHARSIFLQGLLLSNNFNAIHKKYYPILNAWKYFLLEHGITPFEYCVNYTRINPIDKYVIGLRSSLQLVNFVNQLSKPRINNPAFEKFVPKCLYDPRMW